MHALKTDFACTAQDGSMRLYLCVLLRQHPLITQGVCLQMGGNKFIDVYISELGMDRRVQIDTLQPSVVAAFDKDTRQACCLLPGFALQLGCHCLHAYT